MREKLLKLLFLFKDILFGLLFPLMAVGFMYLVAGGMLYFHPQDYFLRQGPGALPERDAGNIPKAADDILLGLKLTLIPALLLWLKARLEEWLKHRQSKAAKLETPKDKA
jgi:hypothetical protein